MDLRKRCAMRITSLVAVLGVLVTCGCQSESEPGDPGFNLISSSTVESIEPSHYSPNTQVAIMFACECRYEGRGYVGIVGHGGGQSVGTISSPVSAEIGSVYYETSIPAGRFEIPISILMTTTLEQPAISITVTYDSLLVDGSMVYWSSPEGFAVFRGDLPEGGATINQMTTQVVTIPRAE
jgi:hypothetical protein